MLDKIALNNFYNSDKESMQLILQQVVDNIHTVIKDIEEAKEPAELNHFLHYHGPSFTYAGLVSVTHHMKQLEDQAKNITDTLAMQGEIKQLIQILTESKNELNNYIAELKLDICSN